MDIIQEAGLNRGGMVAECLYPDVETGCKFEWIDWKSTENKDGRLDNLRLVNDTVGCYSEPKGIDPSSFEYKQGKVADHGLSMPLKECCASACTPDGKLPFKIDAAKSEELVDLLLLGREIRAIQKATKVADYTNLATLQALPGNGSLTNIGMMEKFSEGAYVDFAGTLFLPGTDAFSILRSVQLNNFETGARNKAIMSKATAYKLMEHPSFKDGGCVVGVLTPMARLADLLEVSEICIAETSYNTASPGADFNLARIWDLNGEFIMFVRSFGLATPDSMKRVYGFSAYEKGFRNRTYFDDKMGVDGGDVQVVGHDFTETLADIKCATLVKI